MYVFANTHVRILTGYRAGDVTAQQTADDEQHPREPHRFEARRSARGSMPANRDAESRGKAREPRGSSRGAITTLHPVGDEGVGRVFSSRRVLFYSTLTFATALTWPWSAWATVVAVAVAAEGSDSPLLPPAALRPTRTRGRRRSQKSTSSRHARQGPTASDRSSARRCSCGSPRECAHDEVRPRRVSSSLLLLLHHHLLLLLLSAALTAAYPILESGYSRERMLAAFEAGSKESRLHNLPF